MNSRSFFFLFCLSFHLFIYLILLKKEEKNTNKKICTYYVNENFFKFILYKLKI